MAYSNVGTPVFYVDYLLWRKSFGLQTVLHIVNSPPFDLATLEKTLNLNPSNPITLYTTTHTAGGYAELIAPPLIPSSTSTSTRYFAILGHNIASAVMGTATPLGLIDDTTSGDVVNASAQYDGFTIIKDITGLIYENGSQPSAPYGVYRIMLGATNAPLKVGCYSVGNYYQMPHSPDLKLTMSREMDGVKRIRTKGGNDLVNHKYTKPAMWGDAGAWELYLGTTTNQELSRSGRRTWSLSFNYLQDSDVFPMFSSIVPYASTSPTGWVTDGVETDWSHGDVWHYGETLLVSNNFYSQVIHKTNGGQLPFIFQPDKNDNTNFAICKFDMKSFKFSQVAHKLYNVKLKIREVW